MITLFSPKWLVFAAFAITAVATSGRARLRSRILAGFQASTDRPALFNNSRRWDPSSLPSWLSEECYVRKIQPQLRTIKVREISETMHVSKPYAALVSRPGDFVSTNAFPRIGIGPAKRFRRCRVGSNVFPQFAGEIGNRGENAAGDDVALDLREPQLHLI